MNLNVAVNGHVHTAEDGRYCELPSRRCVPVMYVMCVFLRMNMHCLTSPFEIRSGLLTITAEKAKIEVISHHSVNATILLSKNNNNNIKKELKYIYIM